MKAFIGTIILSASFLTAFAQDADQVRALEQRVQKLEERLAVVERNTQIYKQSPEAARMVIIAKEHVARAQKNISPEDIELAEKLYQQGAQLFSKNEESKKFLDSVVSFYPHLNRAGCAQLYRAQQERNEEKEQLLKDCIARFSTCYYFDGAQVGALATLYLREYYQQKGRYREARRLFRRLRNRYPEAIGHNGELLVSRIE